MSSVPGANAWMDENVWWGSRMSAALEMLDDGNVEGAKQAIRMWLAEERARWDTP